MVCKDLDDFLGIFKKHYDRQYYKDNIMANWVADADVIWQELIIKNKAFFDRHGYIDVEHDPQTKKYYRKKLPKGRPKTKQQYQQIISFRIDDELKDKLDKYCNDNQINQTDVINKALGQFLE